MLCMSQTATLHASQILLKLSWHIFNPSRSFISWTGWCEGNADFNCFLTPSHHGHLFCTNTAECHVVSWLTSSKGARKLQVKWSGAKRQLRTSLNRSLLVELTYSGDTEYWQKNRNYPLLPWVTFSFWWWHIGKCVILLKVCIMWYSAQMI